MLEVTGLSVAYGAVTALRGVSFTAKKGAVTAVLGANGAGKTTLLRTISGAVRPRTGSVRLAGEELLGANVEDIARRGVAHVPEGRGVIEELSVEDNLRLATLWCLRASQRQRAIDAVFELFPRLLAPRHRPAASLSGGQRQMLVLGRALVTRPRLLLLDEPSLGLAPLVTAELMAILDEQTKTGEMTVVLVEQNARSALSIASRAIVLHLGEVVADGPADMLAGNPELRRHYLGF